MKAILVGNQNSGKTTLFNYLTGSNRHVGNFPGVTVDIASGKIINTDIELYDLPGLYSLATESAEEEIALKFLESDIDLIINITDANTIERGLYLTLQLAQKQIPMLCALNMYDELLSRNGKIDCDTLSRKLNIPFLPISAKSGIGCEELLNEIKRGGKIPRAKISNGLTHEQAAEAYYGKIDSLKSCFVLNHREKPSNADRILLSRYFSVPIFLLILGAILFLSFSVFGKLLCNLTDALFSFCSERMAELLVYYNAPAFLTRLVCDGIITGIGSIISFLPCVLLLSFFLAMLEDSGYMARVAFIMDAPMRVFGLSGKSTVPLLLGFGCSVPALLSVRTLEQNRRSTALSVPFIPCSARLPVFMMIASMFFKSPFFVIILLYVISIACALLTGAILKSESTPFIIELPPYRMPKLKYVLHDVLSKATDFLSRAFSIIFLASLVVWLLSNISFSSSVEDNILCRLSSLLAPLFAPLGFDDWRLVAALLSGISAKEAIISTVSVLGVDFSVLDKAGALAFLVFVALYTPCIASLAVIKKEYGNKARLFSVVLQSTVAYAVAFICYTLARLML